MNSTLGQSHHQNIKKRHAMLAASLMMTVWASTADAAEVLSKVTSVGEAGKVELQLPDGAVVMVGDKVRLEAVVSGKDPAAIKTRWTIKAINGSVIEASPDGDPTSSPEVGYQAVINTIAEQPQSEPSATATDETAEKPDQAEEPAAEAPTEIPSETVEPQQSEPEMKAESASEPVEEAEPEAATAEQAQDAAPVEVAKDEDAKDEDAKAETAKTEEIPALRPALSSEASEEKPASEVGDAVVVEVPEPSMDKLKEVEGAAETPAKDEADKAASIPQETAVEAVEAAEEPSMVAKDPAAVTECDTLAAHPFDPEAVSAGVEYEQLDADKVIAACKQAIADLPDVARFYTQLTRGLHKAGRYDEAFEATEKGAELGSAHSMAFLGVMFAQGKTVAKDDAKSLEWYEKAAEKGNPGGMIFAAAMYRDGLGTTRNYQRAVELYRMAADLEVAEAMTSLAIFLDRGLGVEKNVDEATSFLLRAYRLKDLEARKLLFEAPGAISQEMRKQIQTRLKSEGFYKSAIDGEFGPGTRNALVLYGRSAN